MNEDLGQGDPDLVVKVDVPKELWFYGGGDLNRNAQFMLGLGAVVQGAALLEATLRELYCSLVGTKYAATTVAGQDVSWIIECCRRLVRIHQGVTDEAARDSLLVQLARANEFSQMRNRWVHGRWTLDGSEIFVERSARKHGHVLQTSPVRLKELIDTSNGLQIVSLEIHTWVWTHLGVQAAGLEAELRWDDLFGGTDVDEYLKELKAAVDANPPPDDFFDRIAAEFEALDADPSKDDASE